jgi:hypothetical protein
MSEPTRQSGNQGKVQGEGDYEAAQRYRDEVKTFVDKADIDKLAKNAKPASAQEAKDGARAEESGRARSKGDDPSDAKIMYTNQDRKKS